MPPRESAKQRRERIRAQKLEAIETQVEAGELVIRQATKVERARWSVPHAPRQKGSDVRRA